MPPGHSLDGLATSRPVPDGHAPAPLPDEPRGDGSRRVALIVDDEPLVGEMMARLLRSRGWRTVVASVAEEAMVLARDRSFDLLLTDFLLPGMSGFDLARLLREGRPGLPVVLISGSAEAATLELPPPFAFIPKPFGIRPLMTTIGALVAGGPATAPTAPAP